MCIIFTSICAALLMSPFNENRSGYLPHVRSRHQSFGAQMTSVLSEPSCCFTLNENTISESLTPTVNDIMTRTRYKINHGMLLTGLCMFAREDKRERGGPPNPRSIGNFLWTRKRTSFKDIDTWTEVINWICMGCEKFAKRTSAKRNGNGRPPQRPAASRSPETTFATW